MMRCLSCQAKITAANYDEEYEIFECGKCGAVYEEDELREAENGSHPRKKAPQAKGKKRRAEIQDDEEAIAKYEAEALKPRKAGERETKHRDEVATKDVLEIFADEIEAIWTEFETPVDRLNAREYFAMNIFRPLTFQGGVQFREKEVPRVYCKEHS